MPKNSTNYPSASPKKLFYTTTGLLSATPLTMMLLPITLTAVSSDAASLTPLDPISFITPKLAQPRASLYACANPYGTFNTAPAMCGNVLEKHTDGTGFPLVTSVKPRQPSNANTTRCRCYRQSSSSCFANRQI